MEKMAVRQVLLCRSNPIAPDPRVEKAAHVLARAGYAVRVLGWDRTGAHPKKEILNEIECERLRINAAFGTGMGNFIPLLRWQWGCALWMIKNRKEFDVIHACDFDTVLPSLLCKFIYAKRVVYDIFDFYADHLRATPAWIKYLIKVIDRWVLRKVDGVILTDEVRLEQVGDLSTTPWTIIYNKPRDQTQALEKQEHPQTSADYSLRLVYVGLLQLERGILDVLSILRDHPNWHLDLAGFGGDEKIILTKSRHLPNIHWHGRIPYNQALALTCAADVVLALYDPDLPNHTFASPNKLYEAMMLSKPVIVARDTHIDEIVEQEDCGIVVPYGDQYSLEQALAQLDADPALRQKLGTSARRAYERRYNWETMETRLLKLYSDISPNS